uniref:Uncharacterized protein n=1 Tax=Rhizophora mucronata TaxID=61149 RepID=A0A2P2QE50_RHIMU
MKNPHIYLHTNFCMLLVMFIQNS